MKWKQRRALYRAGTRAFLQYLVEQHDWHIFVRSLIDDAPGACWEEKLLFLASGDRPAYQHLTRSVQHRMQCIRKQEVARAMRWYRRTNNKESQP